MLTTDPIAYFATCQLEESRLMRFLYHPEGRTLDLVVDYAAETVARAFALQRQGLDPTTLKPLPTDLRHFQLADVLSLEADQAPEQTAHGWQLYEQQLAGKPLVLTGVRHARIDGALQMSFTLGRFGLHSVRYKTFRVERRLAEGKPVGVNRWQYIDLRTQERIDLFNPFPWIDKEVASAAHCSPSARR